MGRSQESEFRRFRRTPRPLRRRDSAASEGTRPSGWYSRPELNRDQRFRKPLLYPFELREQADRFQKFKVQGSKFKVQDSEFLVSSASGHCSADMLIVRGKLLK